MKKTINGIRYDTERSTEVGTHRHGSYPNSGDFSHWTATLYRTPRSGRFFLAGEGGGMTQFAYHGPYGGAEGGSRLIPISRESALEWAEEYLDEDVIEKHFGDMIEDA